MPKMKTKSGVKKRFKFTATGLVKHGVAGKRRSCPKLMPAMCASGRPTASSKE